MQALRKAIKEKGLVGYIIPSTDEYLCEYSPKHAARLKYITGFSGSNGIAIILPETVLFFTDGRYLNQASKELTFKNCQIFDQNTLANFNWTEYFSPKDRIGYDSKLFTKAIIAKLNIINLHPVKENLVDLIWEDKTIIINKAYDYPDNYAGESVQDKIAALHAFLIAHNASAILVNDPASVCWLLNIRGQDIDFSPLLLAHAIVTLGKTFVFTNKEKVSPECKKLHKEFIEVLHEEEITDFISNFRGKILYDKTISSCYFLDILSGLQNATDIKAPYILWKARKNKTEIRHAEHCHILDAISLCEFLAFLEYGDLSTLTEYDLSVILTSFRAKHSAYVMDSFQTICGFKENGAIIHYKAEKNTAKPISGSGLLLVDSGAQYLGATTDVTRTVAIGQVPSELKNIYTRVLKGHISLASAKFLEHQTYGAHLDILARQYLYEDGKNFPHGTGHGVGSFLNVHEGPQNISPNSFGEKLAASMIVSNEPGYYVENHFGIRIENLLYIKKSNHTGFLEFDNLTLVPYARDLINFNDLEKAHIIWLKNYYSVIREKITPFLSKMAKRWISKEMEIN